MERKLFFGARKCSTRHGYGSPERRSFSLSRIAVPEQQLQLMRLDPAHSLSAFRRPPSEPAFRQAFLAKPKTLPVVRENLDRFAIATAEYEEGTTKWFGLQLLATHRHQAIDALAKVHWLYRDE
jgi:hypothetical protein